jgi:DNA-binding helix-turn-helix protein
MDVKDTIGSRIRQVRIAFNMKQTDFAKEFNMFQSNLSDVEGGRRPPSLELLVSLAKLGVDMKWLLLGNADTSSMMADQRPINTMSLIELKRVQIQQMLTEFEMDELLVLENLLSLINKKKESK